jgi:hypothetical protein
MTIWTVCVSLLRGDIVYKEVIEPVGVSITGPEPFYGFRVVQVTGQIH